MQATVEGGLVYRVFLTSCEQLGACASLSWEGDGTKIHYGKKASQSKQCDALCDGPGSAGNIWVSVTLTHTTFLNMDTKYTPLWQQYSLMHFFLQQTIQVIDKFISGVCWSVFFFLSFSHTKLNQVHYRKV